MKSYEERVKLLCRYLQKEGKENYNFHLARHKNSHIDFGCFVDNSISPFERQFGIKFIDKEWGKILDLFKTYIKNK